MKILVTGANGQLGKSIKKISKLFPEHKFIYTDVNELDITNSDQVLSFFKNNSPEFCINAAAYTNVDKAETEQELNNKINIIGPSNLAKSCKESNAKLIHISSDYVYNNNNQETMTEDSATLPNGIYAQSKLKGEQEVVKNLDEYYIIRTSWLYSEFGHNFVKTIIKLCQERKELKVVNDQIGSPTYATDLAIAILKIINLNNNKFGIYNYSDAGIISWYDFANKIVEISELDCKITPIPSSEFPTKAPRPLNSRLSKEKIVKSFNIVIPEWENSLKKCIEQLENFC
ncbi:MAG TPA: dTDP-4-dehydrorhamnose reductase [Bacteroidetes bacterium]|nr:dTDP-4-dehydrorhamnose reductase [Bacteroidota bacterium]